MCSGGVFKSSLARLWVCVCRLNDITSQTCLRRWSLVWISHWPASLCILIDRPRSFTTATVGNTFACRWSVFSPGFFCARRKSTNLEVFISAHRILYLPSSLPPLSAGALSCCKQVRHLSKINFVAWTWCNFSIFFSLRVSLKSFLNLRATYATRVFYTGKIPGAEPLFSIWKVPNFKHDFQTHFINAIRTRYFCPLKTCIVLHIDC